MKTAILYYFVIGIILNIIGPLAQKMKEEIIKIYKPSLSDIILEREPIPLWKRMSVITVLLILSVVFYPVLFIIITIDYFRKKSFDKKPKPVYEDDGLLYYSQMGGAGIIQCNECDFREDIVSFIHGMDEYACTGHQCQVCGMFKGIEQHKMNETLNTKCECGGNLERDEPLFCPE